MIYNIRHKLIIDISSNELKDCTDLELDILMMIDHLKYSHKIDLLHTKKLQEQLELV